MKRSRGRGRRQQNPLNRSYDSNGPEVRVRGTASQVYEKYQSLARDAMAGGDRVMAENLQQHAEHYYRIIAAYQTPPAEEDQGEELEAEADSVAGDAGGLAEPLVLSRKNADEENGDAEAMTMNGDGEGDGDGGEAVAPKAGRRRGPLRRRRGQNGDTADVEVAGNNNDDGAGADMPEPVTPGEANTDDAALSAGASD